MALPPMLQQHLSLLQSQGYTIEVKEDAAICIEFKNYKIPSHIWDRDTVDLLVIAYQTYPNAKMDMFWVNPPIKLKKGVDAKAVVPDNQCGKTWQRFSWHIETWNAARDNLITYLQDVNARLNKAE